MNRSLFVSIAIIALIILITGCTGTQTATVTPTPVPSTTPSLPTPTPTITPTPPPSTKPSTPASGIIEGTALYNPFGTHNYEYVGTITDYLGTRPYRWADSSLTTDTYNGRSAYHWKVNEYDTSHSLVKTTDYYYDQYHVLLGGHMKILPGVDRDFSSSETGIYGEATEPRNYDYRLEGRESITIQGFTYQDAEKYAAQKTPYDSVTIWVDRSISIPIKIEYAYSNVRMTYELTDMS